MLLFSDARIAGNSGGRGFFNQGGDNLSFDRDIVDNNQGDGIYNTASTATLNRVSVTGNTLGVSGCSVGTTLPRLTLSDSTVTRNSATNGVRVFGGGIGAKADFRRTRISENAATLAGGGGGYGLCLSLLLGSAPPASNQWARRMQEIPVAYGQNESPFADRELLRD